MSLVLPHRIKTMVLDMNGTFMFEHDRLGPEEDFHPAYVASGGRQLDHDELNDAVRKTIARLDELYRSGSSDTNFPQVREVAGAVLSAGVAGSELALIESAIAAHEMGQVSDEHALALAKLSQRYALYVLSNLWSPSAGWKALLRDRLGRSTLSGWVFSSDRGINKPAREIFEAAIALAGVDPADIVMVGDDVERDMRPAAALGMTTVLVTNDTAESDDADYVIPDICALA